MAAITMCVVEKKISKDGKVYYTAPWNGVRMVVFPNKENPENLDICIEEYGQRPATASTKPKEKLFEQAPSPKQDKKQGTWDEIEKMLQPKGDPPPEMEF